MSAPTWLNTEAFSAFDSGLAFSGLVYVIYLALVLWGMRDWWLRSRQTAPALEGAAA